MAEDKKPDTSKKPTKDSVDFGESYPNRSIQKRQDVSNTRPAPTNPHRDNGGSGKDDKR